MKKVSKVISILLIAIMTLSIFAVSASAIATPLTAGNTKETATKIPSYGVEYTSTLSKAGEQDWFKFTTLSQDAYYTFNLQNYNIYESDWNDVYSLNLFVYDTYDKQIAHVYGSLRNTTDIKLEKNTTYYIKVCMGSRVTSSTGNYAMLINYKLDPVSNVKAGATTINVNDLNKYSLDGTGDVDWYKFTVPANATYKISLENYNIYESDWNDVYSLNLFVYDTYDKQVAHVYGSLRNTTKVKLEKNTTYYIKVCMGSSVQGSTGNYGFSINLDGVTPPAETKTLSSISISSYPSKTTYEIGESFDKSGLVVKATYSDGSTANVTSYTITGFDSSKAGTSTVTVTYKESGITRTAAFNVTIKETSSPSTPEEPGDDSGFASSGLFIIDFFIAVWEFLVTVFMFLFGWIGL